MPYSQINNSMKLAILEYDNDPDAVIPPTHDGLEIKLPALAVFAFVGDAIEEYVAEHGGRIVEHFVSITKRYPIYVIEHHGKEICLCQAPCGAPAATQLMDFLIGYGVEKIISTGSCGVLCDIPENSFLVPTKALREEGTSFHYLPAARYVELNREMQSIIESHFIKHNISYETCTTWTTDGFYREKKRKFLQERKKAVRVLKWNVQHWHPVQSLEE